MNRCDDSQFLVTRMNSTFYSVSKLKYRNFNSLLQKIKELRIIAKSTIAAIIGISESKLDEFVLELEIEIDDYKILRCDRNRHGGGAAYYDLRNNII